MANPEGTDQSHSQIIAKQAKPLAGKAAQWNHANAAGNKVFSALEGGAALVGNFAGSDDDTTSFDRLGKEAMQLLLTGSEEQVRMFGRPALRIAAILSGPDHHNALSKRAPLFKTQMYYHILRARGPTAWTLEGVIAHPPDLYPQFIMTLVSWDFSDAKTQFFENSDATHDEKIVFGASNGRQRTFRQRRASK